MIYELGDRQPRLELETAELELLKYAADVYVQNSRRFLDELSS